MLTPHIVKNPYGGWYSEVRDHGVLVHSDYSLNDDPVKAAKRARKLRDRMAKANDILAGG